jgi:hypothetical protein
MNKHHKRKAGKQVTQFTIQNKTYSIRLTNHAELRLKQRNVDLYQTVGSILSLGEKRIIDYSGSNKDIFIIDKENNFSIVCNIEIRTITIITVIDNCDCWVKAGTIAVNL